MTEAQVLSLLEKNKNARGIEHWKRLTGGKKGKSFGIGLTQLRKLAKQVGKDHDLAMKLWKSDVFDARTIAMLIDDPKKMTRVQVEKQVDGLSWMEAHVFCSCDATLTRAPFVRELAVEWADSKEDVRRRCGYLLLAELAKDRKDPSITDAFFEPYIDRIQKTIRKEENLVKDAMNCVIYAAGQRSAALNKRAIAAAKAYWPIEVDYGANTCEPLDVLKHLTGERIQSALR
jgi:3-methyladenine DNA glycosylase AlkD